MLLFYVIIFMLLVILSKKPIQTALYIVQSLYK